MKIKLANERVQLLNHWKGRLKKNPDWISEKLKVVEKILLASNGDEEAQKSLSSYLRQLHDKFGFKAKESLKQGGLCAGAIFRTRAFIETEQLFEVIRLGGNRRECNRERQRFVGRRSRAALQSAAGCGPGNDLQLVGLLHRRQCRRWVEKKHA